MGQMGFRKPRALCSLPPHANIVRPTRLPQAGLGNTRTQSLNAVGFSLAPCSIGRNN